MGMVFRPSATVAAALLYKPIWPDSDQDPKVRNLRNQAPAVVRTPTQRNLAPAATTVRKATQRNLAPAATIVSKAHQARERVRRFVGMRTDQCTNRAPIGR